MAENHSFNILFAQKYGIEEAIVFDNIYHWCLHNKMKDINCNKDADGNIRYWTFNSCKNFADYFIYINPSKIRKVLLHLNELNFILIDNFNKVKYDQTKWYAITEKGEKAYLECCKTTVSSLYSEKSILQNEKCQFNKTENGSDQNEEPIPTSNTNTITNTNTTSNSSSQTSDTSLQLSNITAEQVAQLMRQNEELMKEIKDKDALIDEQNKAISSSKKSKTKTKKQSYSQLLDDDFYLTAFKTYNSVFMANFPNGFPNSKDYRKKLDEAYTRLSNSGYSEDKIKDSLLKAIKDAPKCDYWKNQARGAFAYIVSEAGLNNIFSTTDSQNLNTKKSGGINYTDQTYDSEVF